MLGMYERRRYMDTQGEREGKEAGGGGYKEFHDISQITHPEMCNFRYINGQLTRSTGKVNGG